MLFSTKLTIIMQEKSSSVTVYDSLCAFICGSLRGVDRAKHLRLSKQFLSFFFFFNSTERIKLYCVQIKKQLRAGNEENIKNLNKVDVYYLRIHSQRKVMAR